MMIAFNIFSNLFCLQACIGQGSCSISVSKETLGENNCGGSVPFKLAIQASC